MIQAQKQPPSRRVNRTRYSGSRLQALSDYPGTSPSATTSSGDLDTRNRDFDRDESRNLGAGTTQAVVAIVLGCKMLPKLRS